MRIRSRAASVRLVMVGEDVVGLVSLDVMGVPSSATVDNNHRAHAPPHS